jgi:hypothetical protein
VDRRKLTLTLLVALVLAANDHNPTVSLNDTALVTHFFYRRSYFHFFISLSLYAQLFLMKNAFLNAECRMQNAECRMQNCGYL